MSDALQAGRFNSSYVDSFSCGLTQSFDVAHRWFATIASQQPPPRRFIAGADAVAIAEQKVRDLQEQINANRDLSTSLAISEGEAAGNER